MLDDTGHNPQKTATAPAQNSEAHPPGRHPNSLANLERYKFQPGQSGNPGGRPKKVAKARDRALDEAEAVINFHKGVLEDPDATITEKQRSAQFLWDNGVGRAPYAVDVTQETTHSLSHEFEMLVRELNDRKSPLAIEGLSEIEIIDLDVIE